MGEVERLEGIELLSTLFGGAISTQQMASEIDAYLGHSGMTRFVLSGSNLDGGNEILLAISAKLADGQLRAREDDGLGEILQHIG